jgi:alanine racemase
MSRVVAWIDTDALRRNVLRVRKLAPTAKISAVVKANAYGHSVDIVINSICDLVDGFSVATLDEAIYIRDNLYSGELWVFSGVLSKDDASVVKEKNLTPVVHSDYQISLLKAYSPTPSFIVKVDVGMGRLGFDAKSAKKILQDSKLKGHIRGVMSHFSHSDDTSSAITESQLHRFLNLENGGNFGKSIAASGGILAKPESHLDWVRPGIMLYGVSPFLGSIGIEHQLNPVMSLKSKIIAVRKFKAGETIGYGGEWTCPEDMCVGIVGCGYGDGYPRSISPGTSVLIGTQEVPIIGRVSMDSMSLDIRKLDRLSVGQSVTLWGKVLPIEKIARAAGTIPNELFSRIPQRVARIVKSQSADDA